MKRVSNQEQRGLCLFFQGTESESGNLYNGIVVVAGHLTSLLEGYDQKWTCVLSEKSERKFPSLKTKYSVFKITGIAQL